MKSAAIEAPTLRDVLERFKDERMDISPRHVANFNAAVKWMEQANEGAIDLATINARHIRNMMRAMIAEGRSTVTTNTYRKLVLQLWSYALDCGLDAPTLPRRSECRKLKEPRPQPTAWRPEEMERLIHACRRARVQRGWGPAHWEALVMTVYDTSLRVGCLMKSKLSQLDVENCRLRVPGDMQKGLEETNQPLDPQTLRMLQELPRRPGDDRLFPFPFYRDELWRKYRENILIPAGLPSGPRDKFHKIRRTSYTAVAKLFGVQVASEHAAHKVDMSKHYLDKTLLDRPAPLAALPRPVEKAAAPSGYSVGTDPRLWEFNPPMVSYCGHQIRMLSDGGLRLLETLVLERGVAPLDLLIDVAFDGRQDEMRNAKGAFDERVRRLRRWLTSALNLPRETEVLTEAGGVYTLCLPLYGSRGSA
jgi:integrase